MNRLLQIKINDVIIFFSIFFLFKLPNIYFFPFFKSSVLTTHVLARLLLFILFILNIKEINNLFLKNKIFILVILLFLLQSLSVFQTINITSFISRYKEILVGFTAFYISLLYQKKYKLLMDIFLLTTLFSVSVQILFLIFPDIVNSIFKIFLYDKIYDLVTINLARSRTYFETFDETAIPVIFFMLTETKKTGQKIALLLLLLAVVFVSISSMWRTRLAMLVFGSLASIIFIKRNKLRYAFIITLVSCSLYFLFMSFYNTNVFRRFDLNEENVLSIKSRTDQLSDALMIISQRPLGLGLGNYYDYLSSSIKEKTYLVFDRIQRQQDSLAEENIHNIFGLIGVESGIPAIIIFAILLVLFIKNDCYIIRTNDYPKITFMIGFWIMFIYSLFNPLIAGVANYLLWFLRGYSLRKVRK